VIFSIPILVEERPAAEAKPALFTVRPLFKTEPIHRAEKLSRALTRLNNDLHELLQKLGKEPRHDELADWTFHPQLDELVTEIRLELSSGSSLRRFLFVGYTALDRKLYFTPSLPGVLFEIHPGQTILERATAVLTRHFRALEKEQGYLDLDDYALSGKARLTALDITLHPASLAVRPKAAARAAIFGGEEKMDGEEELRKTGRPLHAMFPDDLPRAIGRDREVDDLARLLASPDRRAILLVGRRQVGKSAVLHELVWQMCARKKQRFGGAREVWLVSPMRLISGMSYLGEWENRVLAILEYVSKTDRVLYFDDLLGLFTAGKSAASDLNVAQVLRPALEKRSLRILAEITPEAWRVLRERDRAFADLFHVIPVNEPIESETVRILLSVTRQLEQQHRCQFSLEVMPTSLELFRRFAGGAAFPGKAAGFLSRLAVRHAGSAVDRRRAFEEFRLQSGLQVALLDDRRSVTHAEIVQVMQSQLIGQEHALHAFADVIMTLKARLNDPRRPLGTFLLLGPTGVGKTEAAKTLATYLFGSADRLLRFDMNEYVEAASLPRLTGTPREPDGLLAGAVRRQPFSVVLFDEIEKAAPEVFDMLLAVLDEGRLTDSLGRVADFTQCVILLTSNLDVREAQSRIGFGHDASSDDTIYTGAAEKFFRPEFFNRLDRVIPFRSLTRADLQAIARRLIGSVLSRDGIKRRECLLLTAEEAVDKLVDLGYHPQLGARALKRVVERELAQPIGEQLAQTPPGAPTIAAFTLVEGKFAVQFNKLEPVEQVFSWTEIVARHADARSPWTYQFIEACYAALDRIERLFERAAPSGSIEVGHIKPEHTWYFAGREQIKRIERMLTAIERAGQVPRRGVIPARQPRPKPTKLVLRQYISGTPRFDRQREGIALRSDLEELLPEPPELPDSPLMSVARELALLSMMAQRPPVVPEALVILRAIHPQDTWDTFDLAEHYYNFFSQLWGATVAYLFPQKTKEDRLLQSIVSGKAQRIQALHLTGIDWRQLLRPAATVLVRRFDGSLGMVQVTASEVANKADAQSIARQAEELGDKVPLEAFGAICHLIVQGKGITDYRSGLIMPAAPSSDEFRAAVLAGSPLPEELDALLREGT
jgi:ATP-dependent Clp protease ATP-binding subunit ClpC